MKRRVFVLFIIILLGSKVFSQEQDFSDNYSSVGLGLDYSWMAPGATEKVFPLLPGIYYELDGFYNSFIGYHFDLNFLFIFTNQEDASNVSFFSISSLLGASLKIGRRNALILSPGVSLGSRGNFNNETNKKLNDTHLQFFAGPGVNLSFIFARFITVGVPFAYYPFCYTFLTKFNNNIEVGKFAFNNPMFKVGLYIGVLI